MSAAHRAIDRLASPGHRESGRFADRPRRVVPAERYRGLRRAFEGSRTKEWVGFTLIHPEIHGAMIIQEAKYLASSEIYLVDIASGSLDEHAASARGGSIRPPADEPRAPIAIRSRDGRLDVVFTPRSRKTVDKQLLVAAIDYAQSIGTYTGAVRGARRSWSFEGVHGVCETMRMRS